MSTAQIQRAVAFEDGGITLMARVYGWANTAINQAAVTSLALKVYEYDTEQQANDDDDGTLISGVGGTLTVASQVYDTLQTGGAWTKDNTGYNFAYTATADHMPAGGKWYRFQFTFTPASGPVFQLPWVVESQATAGS